MRITRPSPSLVVAGIALFVSLGGTSLAAVNYARRAGAVDGKSAVSASSTLSHAAGRLVATKRSGTDKGRIPGKFVSGVPKTLTISRTFEVTDNAPGAAQTLASLSGLGTLAATCNDQAPAAGVEDASIVLTFANQSGTVINVARRVGNGDGAIGPMANQTATSMTVNGSNTFEYHIERSGQNATIQGGAIQVGPRTPTAFCGVYAVVEQTKP